MHVIPASAYVCLTTAWICTRLRFAPEPGIVLLRSAGLGAAIFVFERERHAAEEARAFFADIASKQKRADVLADAVVEVRVPALGLLFERFPAHKDVEWGLAFEDGSEFGLKGASGTEAGGSSGFVGPGVVGLLLDPVAEIAVGQLLQGGVVEAVIVDQGVKAIAATIPQVPEEGAVMKELGVLLEAFVAQPVFEGCRFAAFEPGSGDQGAFVEGAEGGSEELTQASSGGLLAVERRQADKTVFVGEGFQAVGAKGRAIGKAAAGLARPAVAEQAGDGDVERLGGARRMAVEEPLRRVVGIGLGQAVGVFSAALACQWARSKGTLISVRLVTLNFLSIFRTSVANSSDEQNAHTAGRFFSSLGIIAATPFWKILPENSVAASLPI